MYNSPKYRNAILKVKEAYEKKSGELMPDFHEWSVENQTKLVDMIDNGNFNANTFVNEVLSITGLSDEAYIDPETSLMEEN